MSTFSPDGKIFQVEYAQKAVESSGTAIGVRCVDGVIVGVEKLLVSKLLVEGSGRRIHAIDDHIGVVRPGCSRVFARFLACRFVLFCLCCLCTFCPLCGGVISVFLGLQAVTGRPSDCRALVERATGECRGYRQSFGEPIPTKVQLKWDDIRACCVMH